MINQYNTEVENNNEITDYTIFAAYLAANVCKIIAVCLLLQPTYFCQVSEKIMNKLIAGIILLTTLLLTSVYLIIPRHIRAEASVTMHAAMPAVSRTLQANDNWKKWWPSETAFHFSGKEYFISGKIFNAFDIDIIDGKDSLRSRLVLALTEVDSTLAGWTAEMSSSINPFKRVAQYRRIKNLQKNMLSILNSMKAFMEETENIYGIHVTETTVRDSVLIFTRRAFTHFPSAQEIDALIQQLKKYIAANKAIEKNYPMLHVMKADTTHYEAMVAIPVDRRLPETKNFVPKFLLKGGNILEAEVKGGPHTIENAFREFEHYRSDHKYTSPAIPYQLLITDRVREADTSQWITRLYYPVF